MSAWIQLERAHALLRGAVVAALLADACVAAADPGRPLPVAVPTVASTPSPARTNAAAPLWFPIGEQLRYRIVWGFIPVGEVQSTTSWVEEDGRRLRHGIVCGLAAGAGCCRSARFASPR